MAGAQPTVNVSPDFKRIHEHHRNPKLCERCACWDDLTHMVSYTAQQYEELGIGQHNFWHNFWGSESQQSSLPTSLDLSQVDFHPLLDIAKSRGCVVCRMLYDGILSDDAEATSSSIILWRLWPQSLLAQDMLDSQYVKRRPGAWTENFLLSFFIVDTNVGHGEPPKLEPHYVGVELSYTSLYHGLEDAKLWDRRYVNTESVKRWLLECKTTHPEMCSQNVFRPRVLPPGFRLIDVSKEIVVEPQEPIDDYVALSYQWATATADVGRDIMLLRDNLEELQTPGSLTANRLPEVIQDAMQFCRDIGQRYLWVDRLCIFQDSEDEDGSKRHQVEAMDAIYWLATLTLVACADGIGTGLPGASSRPRQNINTQWSFSQHKRPLYFFEPPPAKEIIQRSSWNTRGWTFQECWISRRRIFFGANYALLTCFYYNRGEELLSRNWHLSHPRDWGTAFADVRKNPALAKYRFTDPVDHYRTAVQNYTSRSLGLANDILLAFLGVNKLINEKLQTTSLFGLPKKHLLGTLIWFRVGVPSPDTKGCVPPDIPSWSWASGLGRVHYFELLKNCVGNLVRFWYSENRMVYEVVEATCWFDGVWVNGGRRRPTIPDSLSLDDEVQRFQENTDLINRQYKISDSRIWETCPHRPLEAINRRQISDESRTLALQNPGCLVFNTTGAFLTVKVREAAVLVHHSRSEYDIGVKGAKSFNILSDEGITIGATIGETFPQNHKLNLATNESFKCHVIVLGACLTPTHQVKAENPLADPALGEGITWCLLVMLVERSGHLSSRLAIGMVNASAWEMVKPTWQTIFLV